MVKVIFKVFCISMLTILAGIIIYKSATVPATYDEVSTYQSYVGVSQISEALLNETGNSNNHILNSLAITVSQFFLGNKLWTLRLPNVISFFLLCCCTWVLANRYFDGSALLFCLPFGCIFLNPYLIDFYGLARGYGMANSMMACSIVSILIFSSTRAIKWYYFAILFAALAAYANFCFLIYWAAVNVLLVGNLLLSGYDVKHLKHTLAKTICAAIAFVALVCIPVANTAHHIQNDFMGVLSFYNGTVVDEADKFMYGKSMAGLSSEFLARIVLVIIFLGGVNFLSKIRRNMSSLFSDPFNIVFSLLLLVWIINVFQVYSTKTNYPTGRIALIYYVLFMFVFIFLLRDLADRARRAAGFAMVIILVFLFGNFICCVNLKSVYEWSYDAYTSDVIDYLKEYKLKHPEQKTVDLSLSNCFRFSFKYYTLTHSTPWLLMPDLEKESPAHSTVDTTVHTLFYYTAYRNLAALKNYSPVKRFNVTGLLATVDTPGTQQVLLMHN
jgi:hypothetical protein